MKVISVEIQYSQFLDLQKSEVLKLIEWTNQQPHLPDVGEIEAIIFLYSCRNSIELAKQTIDLYFTLRTHCPEFFAKRDVLDSEVQRAMRVCGIAPQPCITSNGEKIIISKIINSDPNLFSFADVIKLYFMCFDLWLMEEGTASGHVLVIDMEGCVLGHILRLSPFMMKKFLLYLQEACPVRIKGLHFINTVPFMDKLLAIMKPFMKKELMSAMYLHSNIETFHEHVSKEYLPIEYGGEMESFKFQYETCYENLRRNREFFINEETTKRIDEKRRVGKPKNASDIFGVEGNFKKMDID